eukprot:4246175-Prorocentrum_lima.AAC.1
MMRVAAHFYVHIVRRMLHKERVSSVHRYAKGADDSLSGYMFESIHMPALNVIKGRQQQQ